MSGVGVQLGNVKATEADAAHDLAVRADDAVMALSAAETDGRLPGGCVNV